MEFPRQFIFIYFISIVQLASAHYCEWNTCDATQVCCEENICCDKPGVYIVMALCIFLAFLFLCCGGFLVCRYFCRIGRPAIPVAFGRYRNSPRDMNASTTHLTEACDMENNERIGSGPPPPPYSQVVQMRQ